MASRPGVLSSSVGTKLLIGVTGFLLVIYLLIHIAGNLIVFLGPAAFNRYAYVMEYGNPLLPAIELGLLAVFLLHVYKTVTMYVGNRRARPVGYAQKKYAGSPSRKSLASSTMIISGLWLLLFIVVHVKAFRFAPEYEWPAGGRDLYRQELETLKSPLVMGFYVLSMVIVGSHLWHGISSSLQSVGADDVRWTPRLILAGRAIAVLLAGAFIVIAIWAHIMGNQS